MLYLIGLLIRWLDDRDNICLSASCPGQAVLAERIRDLHRERHEARQHPPLYRRGEEEQQPGPGAVAHHRLPRQGMLSPMKLYRPQTAKSIPLFIESFVFVFIYEIQF